MLLSFKNVLNRSLFLYICRCCSHSDVSSHRMSPCWAEELGLQLCCDADETRISKRDRPKVQKKDRGNGSVSNKNARTSYPHVSCPNPFDHMSTPQTSRYIRAGRGNYSMSLLWLPATPERTAVHLLQEQPALLHRHGTDTRYFKTCLWKNKS